MTTTNIKNLPENAKYFTVISYTDQQPYVVVRETAKTKTLAAVHVKRDPEWKPEMHPGGFAAHCSNQHSQTWIFDHIDENDTITIRLTKKGWRYQGLRTVENRARYFYDYNF